MRHTVLKIANFQPLDTVTSGPGTESSDLKIANEDRRAPPVRRDRGGAIESRIEEWARNSSRIADDMLNLVHLLEANDLPTFPKDGPTAFPSEVDRAISEQMLENIIRARRQRSHYFQDGLFADPAWDILLDLTLAELRQHRVCVTDLCIGANVPATTALRWIKQMMDRGLLEHRDDPLDARRKFIELSRATSVKMHSYFANPSRDVPQSSKSFILRTRLMEDYWDSRLHDAVKSSRNAPNANIKQVYVQLAYHYQSLRDMCSVRSPGPASADRLGA